MSGSKSPGLNPSTGTANGTSNKHIPSQSLPSQSSLPNQHHSEDLASNSSTTDPQLDCLVTASGEREKPGIDLTKKQIDWVFAATCYAFGVLKREFNQAIDEELLAIIQNKLDDEPGFHDDTLDFGNNHYHDKLESVVRDTWDLFLSSERLNSSLLDSFDLTQQSHDSGNDKFLLNDNKSTNVVNNDPQQKRQKSAPDNGDHSTTSCTAIMEHNAKAVTPNSSSGGDSSSLITNEMMQCDGDSQQNRKVYLGGLSDEIDENDLREYFKEYGTIVDINIVLHKDTGKRRGFAFVEYDGNEPIEKIVCKKFHTIKNRRIEAKKAIPKMEMDARRRVEQRATLTDAMMVLRAGHPASYLWDGLASTYGATRGAHLSHHHHSHVAPPPPPPPPHPGSHHAAAYHGHLNGGHHPHAHHYAHHNHYGHTSAYGSGSSAAAAANWLIHGGGHSGPSRSSGSNGYGPSSQAASESSWAASVAAAAAAAAAAADYNQMPVEAVAAAAAAASANGAIGPIRTPSYHQHHARSYRPYSSGGGTGGSQRARGFK